jgi:hypothetical protein
MTEEIFGYSALAVEDSNEKFMMLDYIAKGQPHRS